MQSSNIATVGIWIAETSQLQTLSCSLFRCPVIVCYSSHDLNGELKYFLLYQNPRRQAVLPNPPRQPNLPKLPRQPNLPVEWNAAVSPKKTLTRRNAPDSTKAVLPWEVHIFRRLPLKEESFCLLGKVTPDKLDMDPVKIIFSIYWGSEWRFTKLYYHSFPY